MKPYVFAFLLIVLTGPSSLAGATPGEVQVGGQLRNMPLQGLTGRSEFLSRYLGKPLIINVWASYCNPCLAEMGSLERLWQRYSEQFNVIGISIDDYSNRAQDFLARAETTFPHYIDRELMLENMLGAKTIPLTLLIDAEGKVLQKVRGAREWDDPEVIEAIGQVYEMDL